MQEREKDPSVSLSWTLSKASADLLGAPLTYTEEQLATILSAHHFVEVRKTYGGPAPEETARASAASREQLARDEEWWQRVTAALSDAERRLTERNAAL
jgi:hypothetical protein